MATTNYPRTDATVISHTLGTIANGVAILCDLPGISLSIRYTPTGLANDFPVSTVASGGLAFGEGSVASDVFKAGGVLTITASGFSEGGTANVGVLEY